MYTLRTLVPEVLLLLITVLESLFFVKICIDYIISRFSKSYLSFHGIELSNNFLFCTLLNS